MRESLLLFENVRNDLEEKSFLSAWIGKALLSSPLCYNTGRFASPPPL